MNIIKCICCGEQKKYKCPKCMGPYCSSICFQKHECEIQKKRETEQVAVIKSDYIDEEVKLDKEKLDVEYCCHKYVRKKLENKEMVIQWEVKEGSCGDVLKEMNLIDQNGQFIS